MPSLPTLANAILNSGCPTFEELSELREKGWNDETCKRALDSKQKYDRKRTDQQSIKNDQIHFHKNKEIMQGILSYVGVKIHPKNGTFLDLGCCPGGFASKILAYRSSCRGVGICLPPKDSGISLAPTFASNGDQMKRFTVHCGDLSFYDICCPLDRTPTPITKRKELEPFPRNKDGSPLPRFRLAILDAHYRRQQIESDNSSLPCDIPRLLISQLIIALETMEEGGNLIITLTRIERVDTVQILHMLDGLAEQLVTFKPPRTHAKDSLFYAIASGVGKGKKRSKLDEYVIGLKNVWWELTYGGDAGEGRWLQVSDLDFIVTEETLARTYLTRLKELGEQLWRLQADELTRIQAKILEAHANRQGRGLVGR